MKPVFFEDQAALRTWFEMNHQAASELWLGYYTVKSGKRSVSWSESVDEAICFGWIDGIRRSIDEISYCIRFTPRRTGSNWSRVNIAKAEKLIQQGLMHPEGTEVYSKRKITEAGYSYESGQLVDLDESMITAFKKNKSAWEYFNRETPSYRKITIRWIRSAKQETTRSVRFNELVIACENGERIKAMRWNSRKGK